MKQEETTLEIPVTVSASHIKSMQNEGMYDAMQSLKPQSEDTYYLQAYYEAKSKLK